jgi:hypothetical protein
MTVKSIGFGKNYCCNNLMITLFHIFDNKCTLIGLAVVLLDCSCNELILVNNLCFEREHIFHYTIDLGSCASNGTNAILVRLLLISMRLWFGFLAELKLKHKSDRDISVKISQHRHI